MISRKDTIDFLLKIHGLPGAKSPWLQTLMPSGKFYILVRARDSVGGKVGQRQRWNPFPADWIHWWIYWIDPESIESTEAADFWWVDGTFIDQIMETRERGNL